MKIVKFLTKALAICLCCILTLGAVSYISPPIETHALTPIVDDLFDTSWLINTTVNIDIQSQFDVQGVITDGTNSYDFDVLAFGYQFSTRRYELFESSGNVTVMNIGDDDISFGTTVNGVDYSTNITNKIITIIGGIDVISSSLISWLTANAVMISDDPVIPEITTHTPTTLVGFTGFYQDIIFPSLDGLGSTTSNNPVGIARLNGDTGIVIGNNVYSGLVLWSEYSDDYTTTVDWYSLDKGTQSTVNVSQGDLILSALGTDGTMALDIAIIKPYNKGTELPYIYINSVAYPSIRGSMQAYGDTIYYLSADGGAVGDYSYVEVDIENRTYSIPTVEDEDANNTWAIFQRLNSQWIAEINSYNVGVSDEFGNNLIIDTLKAPFTILDSITLFMVNGTAITLAHLFGALIGLSLFFLFLKLFAGG